MHIDYSSLRSTLPYIRLFRNKLFVIKLSGDLCEDAQVIDHILEQLAFLNLVGIKIVVVHGGGQHATRLGEKLGVTSQFIAGRRVTSKEMMEVIKMSFAGQLNTDIIAQFKKQGIAAIGLSGIDGDLLWVHKRPPLEVNDPQQGVLTVDYGYVADIEAVNSKVLLQLMNHDYLPVVCSLAADDDGQILNINADTLATQIAIHLGAEKLCILGTVDGVMGNLNDPTSLFSLLSIQQAEKLLQDKAIAGGMIPKLTNAVRALQHGVKGVHIINGKKQDVILQEIYTNEGAGTMVVS